MKRVVQKLPLVCLIMICVMTSVMVVGLVLVAMFGRPIADQYAFMSEIRDNGVLGYTASQYMTWSGRLIQPLGIGFMYKAFGYARAQMMVPIIFLAIFGAVWSWLIFEVVRFKKHKLAFSIVIGYLMAGIVLFTTVCLFDIYLWLDSAFVHLLGMIMVVYNVAMFTYLVKHKDELKQKKWLVTIMLLIAFVGQTASEASMLLIVGWSFVAFLTTCFVKKWNEYRRVTALIFVVLMIGGLVMVLAPGLWARADVSGGSEVGMIDILIKGPIKAYGRLFRSLMQPWKLAILLIAAMGLGVFINNKIQKKNLLWLVIAGVLVMASLTYVPMVAYYYGTHAVGAESRVLGMPAMGLSVGLVIIIASIVAYFLQKLKMQKAARFSLGLMVAIAIIFPVGLIGVLKMEEGYVATLAVRAAVVDEREAMIMEYKQGLIDTLEVEDAPVMLEDSDATDFSANGYTTVNWFYRSFLNYYGLEDGEFRVVGEKLVYGNAPNWYEERERNACVIRTEIVFDKYYCANVVLD